MRSLIVICLLAVGVLAAPQPTGAIERNGGVDLDGREMTVSVSRDGSPGRERPGSSRWEGCLFWAPLSEEEAEAQIDGRAPISEVIRYFDSDDPTAEFLVWDCPYGEAGVYREFGGWEVDDTPPVNVGERLADYAVESVWIPELIPETSPDGSADIPLIVNLDTWLWVEEWTDQSATAWLDAFPAQSVTVTLTPIEVIYDPGTDAPLVSCDPGIEWSLGLVESDCVTVYELLPEADTYTVTAEVFYEATVTCPANWCNAPAIQARLNTQLTGNPFESERDVFVEQSRGLVTN